MASFPSANNASNSKEDDEILTLTEPVNSRGLLPRDQGMYFYHLFSILGHIGATAVNNRRMELNQSTMKLVKWNSEVWKVPIADRLVVAAEILASHQKILSTLRKRDVQLRLFAREITEAELSMMEQWKFHVVDDFVVVGHTPRGAVFVQVTEDGKENVYVVRGLADKISKLCNPSAFKECGMKYGVFHTALVPSPDGNAITYVGALVGGGSENFRYRTPKYMDDLFQRASGAYERARTSDTIHYTLINKTGLIKSPEVDNNKRSNYSKNTMASADLTEQFLKKKVKGCKLQVSIFTWSTTNPSNRWLENQSKFFNTLTSPEKCEGFKNIGEAEVYVQDNEICPFCYGQGPISELTTHTPSSNLLVHKGSIENAKPFSRCCKKYYLSRHKRNLKKRIPTVVMLNPVPKHVVQQIVNPYLQLTGQNPRCQLQLQRYGFREVRQISVSLPSISELDILRKRLNEHDGFHPTGENKWDFIGFYNMVLPEGVITYGDISINVEAVTINFEVMTFGRAEILIKEMEYLCFGLHPFDACIYLSKNVKNQKVDTEADSKIRKLIGSWMDYADSEIKSEGVKKEYWKLSCSY
eukprot:g4079.t1